MASAHAAAPPPTAVDPSVAILKQVKATEAEWEAKLALARRDSEESLARLQRESNDLIEAATVAAERERADALERARQSVQAEVAQILEEGERNAAAAARTTGKRPQDRADRVIAVVLGPLARS